MSIDRDFRTDTTTLPLPEMLVAAQSASLGDAVFNEDPATRRLEQRVAELTGKPAGLFCVSGTLSNQIAVRTHLHQPPHSVVLDHRAHIYSAEAGGLATLSQAMPRLAIPTNGVYVTLEDIQNVAVTIDDDHVAPTKLICLENTLSGTIIPLFEVKRISEWARSKGIHMHLDGARIWNASAATDIPLNEWCQYFDSISLCLSKGMCAPIGSVLVGPTDYISKAKWFRKQQGGGIRQSGWLAEAALVAIDKVWPTMKRTHMQAQELKRRLAEIGVETVLPVETNMVVIDTARVDMSKLQDEVAKRNVKVWGARLVLHYWITDDAIESLVDAIRASLKSESNDSADNGPVFVY